MAQSSFDANIVLETRKYSYCQQVCWRKLWEKIGGAELKEITKTIKDDNDLMRKYYKNMDSSKDYKQKYEAIAEKI